MTFKILLFFIYGLQISKRVGKSASVVVLIVILGESRQFG